MKQVMFTLALAFAVFAFSNNFATETEQNKFAKIEPAAGTNPVLAYISGR